MLYGEDASETFEEVNLNFSVLCGPDWIELFGDFVVHYSM